MDEFENQHLTNLVNWRKKNTRRQPAPLADSLTEIMEKNISPNQSVYQVVSDFFQQVLPPQLLSHCKIADVQARRVKIIVDSPVYLHEFRLISNDLLQQLQNSCPQAKIKDMKFTIG